MNNNNYNSLNKKYCQYTTLKHEYNKCRLIRPGQKPYLAATKYKQKNYNSTALVLSVFRKKSQFLQLANSLKTKVLWMNTVN